MSPIRSHSVLLALALAGCSPVADDRANQTAGIERGARGPQRCEVGPIVGVTSPTFPPAEEGVPFMFNLEAFGRESPVAEYTFDCGNGPPNPDLSQTPQPPVSSVDVNHSCIYPDQGNYVATFTAVDVIGGACTHLALVSVQNVAPSVTADFVTGNEGQPVTVTVDATDVPADQPLTYIYTFGDGSPTVTTNTPSVEHTYPDNGFYALSIQVNDDITASFTSARAIIDNVAPTATGISPAAPANEGQPVMLQVDGVSDVAADLPILQYEWDFDNDGSFDATTSINMATTTYPDDGLQDVRVVFTDKDGGSGTVSDSLPVNNVDPTVPSINVPPFVPEGLSRTFSAQSSDVAADQPLTYTFTWGDGTQDSTTSLSTASIAHAYPNDGLYTLTVTVTDGDGGSSSNSQDVVVLELPPIFVDEGFFTAGPEGVEQSLSAPATDVDQPITYVWTFGDGTSATVTGSSNVEHAWPDDGSYSVTIGATDSGGNQTYLYGVANVFNASPTITSENLTQTVTEGDTVQFIIEADDVAADQPLRFDINFGDGDSETSNVTTTATFSHTYAAEGTYFVAVSADDNQSGTDFVSGTLTVENGPPVLVSHGIPPLFEGQSGTLQFSASDPGGDSPITYDIDFGDSTSATVVDSGSISLDHTYPDDGDYTVTVTVSDPQGASSTSTLLAVVSNVDPTPPDIQVPVIVNEGSNRTYGALSTDVPADSPLQYTFDFGDGTHDTVDAANVASLAHTYGDDGTYTLTVTTTDGDGGSSSSSVDVEVREVAPVLNFEVLEASGDEGEAIQIVVSASGVDQPFSYEWDFGDGTIFTTSSTTVTHTWNDDADFPLQLTVRDQDDSTATAVGDALINNVDPVIVSVSNTSAVEGAPFDITLTTTDVSGDQPLSYVLHLSDGTVLMGSVHGTTTFPHTFADVGTYSVNVQVDDGDGGSASSSLTIDVADVQPTVSVTGPDAVDEGNEATFDVGIMGSPTDTYTYVATYDDGTSEHGAVQGNTLTLTHRFEDGPSTGSVMVRITDDDSSVGFGTATLAVSNLPPSINGFEVTAPNVFEGQSMAITVTASDVVPDQNLTYQIDFGDGTLTESLTTLGTAFFAHVYADDGTVTVTVTATDKDGGVDSSALTIEVQNTDPVINDTELSGNRLEGTELTLSIDADDAGDDTLTYEVDWGDGSPPNITYIANLTHTYGDNGTFQGSVTVRDGDGGGASVPITVTTDNVAPDVSAGSDQDGLLGELLSFAGSFSDPGFLDTHTFEWDFGDGSTSDTLAATHVFSGAGVFTVVLTVIDDDGGRSSSSLQVDVVQSVEPCELVISEFIADPHGPDLEREWIEIQNASVVPIDLRGLTLTHGAGSHSFSSLVVPPGGYILVCSDADASSLHCDVDFEGLSMELTDTLVLSSGSTVISTVSFVGAIAGQSFGVPCAVCDPATGLTEGHIDLDDPEFGRGGFGTPGFGSDDLDLDGVSACDQDCDDADPNNFGGNHEVCDGQDNNCDDAIDEGFDADQDGVADCFDACEGFDDNLDSDEDGIPDDCDDCPLDGDPGDADFDGVCDSDDICPDSDDLVDTDQDGVPDGCDLCPLDLHDDSDNDGVCDSDDLCPDFDDSIDGDQDGIPSACDDCPDDADPGSDLDGDGVCNIDDLCPGSDDGADSDGDGVADGCDLCPNSNPDDSDGDLVCDDVDICLTGDDNVDTDQDGIPNACDLCPLDGDPGDDDGDGICNSVEICEGGIDTDDTDGDGVCDFLDPCPADNPDDTDGDGVCDSADICDQGPDGTDTDQDGTPDSCDLCPTDNPNDSDGDGVCDGVDACPHFDDATDGDGDGRPDACDPCPIDDPDDTDGDGVCDSDDLCDGGNDANDADGDGVADFCDFCPNGDDTIDTDNDGVADDCDDCPLDALDDSDGDGICDSDDICPGHDDRNDSDGDGIPDSCDPCPTDNPNDSDGDGVCDHDDECPNGDDTVDTDGDEVADDCDECPNDPDDLCNLIPTADTGESDTDTDTDADTDTDTDTDTDADTDVVIDLDGDGFTTSDCDDNDPNIHPGAEDIAGDGIDQDCDGTDQNVCGCATPGSPAGFLWLGLVGLLLRRRVH